MAKSRIKTKTTSKKKVKVPARDPQKRTPSGISDNLRKLPHPVEEILGLTTRVISNRLRGSRRVTRMRSPRGHPPQGLLPIRSRTVERSSWPG